MRRFTDYYLRSDTIHRAHNDLIYNFCSEVLEDNRFFYIYGDMVPIEEALKNDFGFIEVTDFGAGSIALQPVMKKRQIRKIYKKSSSNPSKGQLLSKLVRHFKPKSILEIGSNLGVSSGYLAGTLQQSKFIGLEGCPELSKRSRSVLEHLRLDRAQIITGSFDQTLPEILKTEDFDFVFLDGNHNYTATLRYFNWLKAHHQNQILVFDDIYWNPQMAKAWDEIKRDPLVDWSIDLFQIGIIALHSGQNISPQHHTLIPYWKKPYQFI